MSRYAQATGVSVGKSKEEVERILARYGAQGFQSGWDHGAGLEWVMFRRGNVVAKLTVPLPEKEQFRFTPRRKTRRSDADAEREWEQARRQNWRALALVIKAKLEAVAAGISSFEREFLADLLLPNGQTVAQHLAADLSQIAESGRMKRLLLPGA